jgi:SAM-dependent methyltransferase
MKTKWVVWRQLFVWLMVLAAGVTVLRSQQPQHRGEPHRTGPPHMEHRFDDAERWAKSFDDPSRDAWQMPARVIEALELRPGQIVADIGAGTGYFTVRLAKSTASPKVYALDIEPSMVAYVRERAAKEGLKNVVAVQAASDRTNLPEPVDLVLTRCPAGHHRFPQGFARGAAARVPLHARADRRRAREGWLQPAQAPRFPAAADFPGVSRARITGRATLDSWAAVQS